MTADIVFGGQKILWIIISQDFYRISNTFVAVFDFDVSSDSANVDSASVGGNGTPLILLISCVYEQSADGLYFNVGTGT